MYTFVFKFRIIWKDGTADDRYVVADTEEEAEMKLEKHRLYVTTHDGVMDFTILSNPTIQMEYLIK